jgi:hypothetical protein
MTHARHAAPGLYQQVEDLKFQFSTEDGVVRAIDRGSFSIERVKTLIYARILVTHRANS